MLQQLREGVRDWLRADDEKHLTDISLEYAYKDLYDATGGFRRECRLGAGAAGAVYRGTLKSGTEVAIKVLLVSGGLMGFEDEVRVLSRFRHPNLVTLLGWGQSQNEKEKYLIYELLEGGDVGGRLEKCRNMKATFPWQHRLRVALDAACGLSHMLNSTPKAFHRDIKPANILLDAGGGAKMADFGLAHTIRDPGKQHMMVDNISGTPGYACPVYIQTGRVTEQSEVYSFGVVLLELLVNQPPALAGPQGDIIYPLLQTVQPAAPGAHARVLGSLDPCAAWPPGPVLDQFAELALSCVDMVPERRPLFEGVVMVLRRLAGAQQLPHHAAAAGPRPPANPQMAAVLECTLALGADLKRLPPEAKAIALPLDKPVEIGRQQQVGFFERLLQAEPSWSSFISRTHCRVQLSPSPLPAQEQDALPPRYSLRVENMSPNPVFLCGRPLQKGWTDVLPEGGTLSFRAKGKDDKELVFLELKMRQARGLGGGC